MDGLTPKYLAEEERVIKRSQEVWRSLCNESYSPKKLKD